MSYPEKYGSGVRTGYTLSRKGIEFCRKECGVDHCISNGEAHNHNENVSRWVTEHLTKDEINTLLSERELSDYIEDRLNEYREEGDYDRYDALLEKMQNGSLSMPDVVWVSKENQLMCAEITTDSYGQEIIEAKAETALELEMQIIFVPAT